MPVTADPAAQPQIGDLVFKPATTTMWTEAAAFYSRGDKRWGHVGLIIGFSHGEPVIVHADMGEPGEAGRVRADPLHHFRGQARYMSLFRLKIDDAHRVAMALYARALADNALPFDHGFSLDSQNSAYCTELVWRAWMVAAGSDPIPEKSLNLGKQYIALSDLSLHPHVQEIGPLAMPALTD